MLSTVLDTLCWLGGFGSIAAYVAALLRNRPYLRPMNSLGLLLLGGAMLGVPRLYPHPMPDSLTVYVVCTEVLLFASAVFQVIPAFRRRKPRAGDAAPAKPAS